MTLPSIPILSVQEQTVDDPVSGFVFKFIVVPGSENPFRILFKKSFETTWREYVFDKQGEFGGATTRAATESSSQPALRLVK